MTLNIGYIVGSTSANSENRRLARALTRLAPHGVSLREILISELGFYNRDLDGDYPAPARAFKAELAAVDAVILVTPEYNRGLPGYLKNALDWASHPVGENSLSHKPSAVIGASVFPVGTALAQAQARTTLAFLGSPCLTVPEAHIQVTPGYFDAEDRVSDPRAAERLGAWLAAFIRHVQRERAA
ncbi:NADPH-dependent FMN reductase [Mycetocola spongiae]|uniref:NADPH-dependent FMN reductase n=1 Tax=Mycetocola spongiae TaxID=2859226 RepID=UPI001CF51767|nr:NADPH-dependent FMN reductase [Mycetocola spongiae]UCR89072.1 NAD(P)H-dependent oxidoreductase [Mycetocola spongiae]